MQTNFGQIDDFVRRVYNPQNLPAVDASLSIQPYAYRLLFQDLAAGALSTQQININANADFIITSPRYRCYINDTNNDVAPAVTVLLTDTGSSEQLTNDQVDLTTYFGHIGTAPYEFEYPRIISGRSALTVQLFNYSSALTYNIELTFAGVQVRSYGRG